MDHPILLTQVLQMVSMLITLRVKKQGIVESRHIFQFYQPEELLHRLKLFSSVTKLIQHRQPEKDTILSQTKPLK